MDKRKSLQLIMKTFLTVLLFTFFFHSWTKADDIRDFEIEGLTIGDSLLERFTEKEIKNPGQNNIYFYPKSRKIYEIALNLNSELYDEVQFSLKENDKSYEIFNINGTVYFKQNFDKCLKKKKEIEKTLSKIFDSDQINVVPEKGKHPGDETGRSFSHATWYVFQTQDHVGVVCTDWHADMKLQDSLKVLITTKEYNDFLSYEAY